MSTDEMMKLVAEGKVAIYANKNHTCLNPEGVGSMLRTKINVNLGVSRDCKDYDIEMQKVMSAVNLGAEAIMDLSSHGNTQPFRQKHTADAFRIQTCVVFVGTDCNLAFSNELHHLVSGHMLFLGNGLDFRRENSFSGCIHLCSVVSHVHFASIFIFCLSFSIAVQGGVPMYRLYKKRRCVEHLP